MRFEEVVALLEIVEILGMRCAPAVLWHTQGRAVKAPRSAADYMAGEIEVRSGQHIEECRRQPCRGNDEIISCTTSLPCQGHQATSTPIFLHTIRIFVQ